MTECSFAPVKALAPKTAASLGRFGQDFRSLVCALALLARNGCASIRDVYLPFGVLMNSSVGIN